MIIRNIRLTITEKCNLNCIYCYEKHKSTKMMSIETAARIIDNEFFRAETEGIGCLNIEFFGGEPFLNFDIIKSISETVLQRKTSIKVTLSAVTNGTAFTDDAKKWLFENKDHFDLGFSIDGKKTTQDHNRSNSFDLLDKEFIATYPHASIKATISPFGVSHLSEDMIYLHSFNCPVGCNIDYDASWNVDDKTLDLFTSQLKVLIDFYVRHPKIKPCTILNMPVKTVLTKPIDRIMMPCGAGTTVVAYSCDGTVFPCQGFMPLSQTTVPKQLIDSLTFTKSIPLKLLDKACQICPIVNSCPNCFASNLICRGDIYKRPLTLCKLIKLFYKASAFLLYKKLEKGDIVMSPEEEMRTLLGIRMIQKSFY